MQTGRVEASTEIRLRRLTDIVRALGIENRLVLLRDDRGGFGPRLRIASMSRLLHAEYVIRARQRHRLRGIRLHQWYRRRRRIVTVQEADAAADEHVGERARVL